MAYSMSRNPKTGQFEQGVSGNPAGRPKGSRSKLGEAFIEAVCADFEKHGVAAIQEMRKSNPAACVSMVAKFLPREVPTDDFRFVALMPQKSASAEEWLRDWGPQEPIGDVQDGDMR